MGLNVLKKKKQELDAKLFLKIQDADVQNSDGWGEKKKGKWRILVYGHKMNKEAHQKHKITADN